MIDNCYPLQTLTLMQRKFYNGRNQTIRIMINVMNRIPKPELLIVSPIIYKAEKETE